MDLPESARRNGRTLKQIRNGTGGVAPAAVAHGVAVVMTGTRSVSDSRRLITGIAAPPPAVATAARLTAGILLRSSTSPSASRKVASGCSIRLSSSARVIWTSAR